MPMTSSFGSPLPGIKEAKLLKGNLVNMQSKQLSSTPKFSFLGVSHLILQALTLPPQMGSFPPSMRHLGLTSPIVSITPSSHPGPLHTPSHHTPLSYLPGPWKPLVSKSPLFTLATENISIYILKDQERLTVLKKIF